MTLSRFSNSSSQMFPSSLSQSSSSSQVSNISSSISFLSPPLSPVGPHENKNPRTDRGHKTTCGNKSSYKHIPHRLKPPNLVAKRNARERNRVQAVNSAFLKLRKHIPFEPRHRRLSKVKTLRFAIEYIRRLRELIQTHDHQIYEENAYYCFSQHEHHPAIINREAAEYSLETYPSSAHVGLSTNKRATRERQVISIHDPAYFCEHESSNISSNNQVKVSQHFPSYKSVSETEALFTYNKHPSLCFASDHSDENSTCEIKEHTDTLSMFHDPTHFGNASKFKKEAVSLKKSNSHVGNFAHFHASLPFKDRITEINAPASECSLESRIEAAFHIQSTSMTTCSRENTTYSSDAISYNPRQASPVTVGTRQINDEDFTISQGLGLLYYMHPSEWNGSTQL